MRILLAPDSFKGSLTSDEAVSAIAMGIKAETEDVEIIRMPLADGGEGTLNVLSSVDLGDVRDGVFHNETYSLIESACFIGLNLPLMHADVFKRGSTALGEAVLLALDAGVKDVRIALGGSATVDGGMGLLLALGCRVVDKDGMDISPDLNGLMRARSITIDELDQRLNDVCITVLSDVKNSLCGSKGAVCMYGAQKGIEVARLNDVEVAMQNWAELSENVFGKSVQADAGTGAAGGLGFALKLLGGRIVSGAEYVMQATGFEKVASTVDWVVTGEGRSDAQTLDGKLPIMVAQAARKVGAKVALISGDVSNKRVLVNFFDDVVAARPDGCVVAESMRQADYYLSAAAAGWMKAVLDGDGVS